MRTFKYNKGNGRLLDMTAYYMEIPDSSSVVPSWKLEYNFTMLYDVPDLSADSLSFVISDWMRKVSSKFDNYLLHLRYLGGEVSCNYTCQLTSFCAASQIDYENFDICIDEYITLEEDEEELLPSGVTVRFMLVVFYSLLVIFFLVSIILSYLFCCKKRRENRIYSPLPNYIQM